jgi:hypothetical protein
MGLAIIVSLCLGVVSTPPVRAADPCPEPNDTFQNACNLSVRTPAGGTISRADDVDAYRFQVLDFNTSVHLELATRPFDYQIDLADWEGNVIGSAPSGTLDIVLRVPGAYYAFVHSPGHQFSDDQPYLLSLRATYGTGSPPSVLYASDFRSEPVPGCTDSHGPASATCTAEDGRVSLDVGGGSTADDPTVAWLWLGPPLTDFTIVLDVRVTKPAHNAGWQVVFRDIDYGNGLGASVDVVTGRVSISKGVDGQVRTLSSDLKTSAVRAAGVNRVVLRGSGAEIHMYVNGDLIANVTDDAVTSGRVGFSAYAFDDPFSVRFDNILVTTPGSLP